MEQQTEHLQRNGIIGRMRLEHFQQRIKKTCLRLTRCRMAELYSPMICMNMMERLLSRLEPIPVRRYLHRCITSYPWNHVFYWTGRNKNGCDNRTETGDQTGKKWCGTTDLSGRSRWQWKYPGRKSEDRSL